MDIKKARKLLGKQNDNISDQEIMNYIETAEFFANIAIDKFIKTPTGKRNLLEREFKNKNYKKMQK